MARRKSTLGLIKTIARDVARAEREKERQRKAAEREFLAIEKQKVKAYKETRALEVDRLNANVNLMLQELGSILEGTLNIDDTISFDSLKIKNKFRKPPEVEKYKIKKLNFIESLIPGATKKFNKQLDEAQVLFDQEYENFTKEKIIYLLKIKQRNMSVDNFKENYENGDPESIVTYCNMVLERSEYPSEFPQEFRMVYLSDSKELVIEYELPNVSIIPPTIKYTYVKSRDTISEKATTKKDITSIYRDIVAGISLRTIHEIFESDQGNFIDVIVFNGFIQTVDQATGHDIRPYLLSVRTTDQEFNKINLARVEKFVCLRNLGAQLSPKPEESIAVRPLVDFNMVDSRFVEQSDVLSDIESRPNLMDLDPFEFENLISNLFSQMGFETKQTQTSRDGGIDSVAFDNRPIVGGKIVIQAKRYKNVVGVSAVRDLYGSMINEGANKGILVTTSHYGKSAYEFVKNKPIELIDGGGLLYMLRDVGTEARIIFPEE